LAEQGQIPTLRVLKHYPADPAELEVPRDLREDISVRFLAPRTSVTPVDPPNGDRIVPADAYDAGPIAMVELREGAVVRDGSFVFTARNELLRESVDRLASISDLTASRSRLEAELDATPPEPLDETVAVLGCQRARNYFHWWIDVLAKCWAIRNSPYRSCRLVTPPLSEDFQWESLRLLRQGTTPLTRPVQRFRRLLYADGLTQGASQAIAPQAVEFAKWCRTALELSPAEGRRAVFVSRRLARHRRLLNEDEVAAALGPDFERVDLETLRVREKAALFAEAGLIVAPHGAGLTNLLFCERPTPVVELVHDDDPPLVFSRLAELLGHPYVAVGCKPERHPISHPGNRDMTASPADVAEAASRLRAA
jgi:capsular polysaccharide biosynthesis protein